MYGKTGYRHLPDKDGRFFNTGSLKSVHDEVNFEINGINLEFFPMNILQLVSMRGKWSFGHFAISEAITLTKGIESHMENEGELEE